MRTIKMLIPALSNTNFDQTQLHAVLENISQKLFNEFDLV